MCGAFSDKWLDVSRRCGKEADALQVEWGQPILPGALDRKLADGGFDTVTVIHNETSTGVMSPLRELCAVVKKYPGCAADRRYVSSFSAVPIPMDELGIDVLLTGSQKALALPPGLALFSVEPTRLRARRDHQGPRLLFRFPRVQEEPGGGHDAEHPGDPAHLRARSPSSRTFSPRESRLVTRAMPGLTRIVADWVARQRVRVFRARGLPVKVADLREEQPGDRCPRADQEAAASDITASSTAATASSRARPSASRTWATRPTRPSTPCWAGWTIAWHREGENGTGIAILHAFQRGATRVWWRGDSRSQ